ncbi:Os03g0399600, partial [Oryza sativa Japonica Group]
SPYLSDHVLFAGLSYQIDIHLEAIHMIGRILVLSNLWFGPENQLFIRNS